MFNITQLPSGGLKITAGNAGRAWIKENEGRGYWSLMADIFEPWSTNGSFTHFDAGQANPFVGLTDAPCVAQSMCADDDGTNVIDGKLWAFHNYMLRNDLDELKTVGHVVYGLVN